MLVGSHRVVAVGESAGGLVVTNKYYQSGPLSHAGGAWSQARPGELP
jgi:hypothetical protein